MRVLTRAVGGTATRKYGKVVEPKKEKIESRCRDEAAGVKSEVL